MFFLNSLSDYIVISHIEHVLYHNYELSVINWRHNKSEFWSVIHLMMIHIPAYTFYVAPKQLFDFVRLYLCKTWVVGSGDGAG